MLYLVVLPFIFSKNSLVPDNCGFALTYIYFHYLDSHGRRKNHCSSTAMVLSNVPLRVGFGVFEDNIDIVPCDLFWQYNYLQHVFSNLQVVTSIPNNIFCEIMVLKTNGKSRIQLRVDIFLVTWAKFARILKMKKTIIHLAKSYILKSFPKYACYTISIVSYLNLISLMFTHTHTSHKMSLKLKLGFTRLNLS